MKKRNGMLVFMLLVLGGTLFGDTSKDQLNQVLICKKAVAIQKMINRHQFIVSGLMTLGSLQALAVGISFFSDYFGEHSNVDNGGVKATEKMEVSSTQQEQKKGFFASLAHNTKDLFCTSNGWYRIGLVCLNIGGQIGSTLILQKVLDELYHPDTLRWYIHAHVPYEKITHTIESLAQKLMVPDTYNEEQITHYRQAITLFSQQLVGCGEDLCAYMTYKSAQLPECQNILAEKSARYLLHYQNDLFKKLFAELEQAYPRYDAIVNMMRAYRVELKYQRKLFSSIEAETKQKEKNIAL